MTKLNHPLAAVGRSRYWRGFALFLLVTVGGSWFVLQRGKAMRQQRSLDEASAVYSPPLAEPMAQSALPWPFAFEALPQKLRWRRVVNSLPLKAASSRVCFWVDFSPGDYALLQKPWGFDAGGRHQGLFVDGGLPAWFVGELCREELLCPGKEEAILLRPSEVFASPRGRQRLYAVPRLHSLLGCIEEA